MYYVVSGRRNRWTYEKWFKPSEFRGFDNPAKTARESAYSSAAFTRKCGGTARVSVRHQPEPATGFSGWATLK